MIPILPLANAALITRMLIKQKKEEKELNLKIEYKFSKKGKKEESARKRALLEEVGIM